MFEPQYYDSPPMYSPPYSTTSHSFYPPRSVHSPQSQYIPYTSNAPQDSYYQGEKPQLFYRWFSPPGFVKVFQGTAALMCFLIFAFVASTLVWDMNGFGYGGYGIATSGISGAAAESGYYGGSYGYSSSYMTPQSAKAAMISMASINFLISLGFLVASFSRSRLMRGCSFYLTVFISNIILAVLQGIIDIIFVIGVNPMSQSSQSMLYNPMLMMCQNIQGTPSLSSSLGASYPGSNPMYIQYLHHYCYMDPEEAVALVLGLMVVVAMSFSAYYAYKTRSKIWRHGKANILWDEPQGRPSEGHDVQDWVDHVGDARSTQQAPTVVVSERATAPELRTENSVVSYGNGTVSIHSEGNYKSNIFPADNSNSCRAEPLRHKSKATVSSSSSSEQTDSCRKPHHQLHHHVEREQRQEPEHRPAAQNMMESQYETGYTTGDTGNELDRNHTQHLYRLYPEIITDEQRRQYKREFDSDLACYKSLCAQMDDISDQMHKLSREMDKLDKSSVKYQGVADEYNRLKDLKKTTDYQAKKRQCKELRQKLFHIKRLVKIYDQGLC